MKTPIAVTLIIMGALLIMTPVLADFLYQRNVVALLSQARVERVTLAGQIGDLYRIGCWLTGSMMIGVSVLRSLFAKGETHERATLAAQAA